MRVWILGGRLSVWKRLVKVSVVGIRLYLGVMGKGRPKTLGAPMQGGLGALAAVLVTIRVSGASAGSFGVWVVGLVRSGVLCPPTLAQILTI